MATITIKNIPDETYNILKQQVIEHRRSINSEVIHLIEKVTRSTRFEPGEHLAVARKLREKTGNYTISDGELSSIKDEGRP